MRAFHTLAAAAIVVCFARSIPAYAADSAAGQATFAASCAACHKLKAFAGKSETDLETKIKAIVDGTVKHPKKLTLSADDIANVATYISSNQPK